MSYVYNIQSSIKDKRSANCLTGCHMLATVVSLFVSTFLVAYIYEFNGNIYDYIFNVGIFNLVTYVAFLLIYGFVAYFVDKTNRIWFYRVGLVLRASLVVLVVFCGKELSKLLIVAGLLNGLSEAFYYSSYNVIKQEMVSRKSMSSFSVLNNALAKVVEVVCPVLLGLLIDVTTYSQVAIIVFLLCVFQIGMSMGIRAKKPTGSRFDLKGYFKKLKQHPIAEKKIMLVYLATILYGSFTIITIALNICIMMEFGSSFSLGTLTSVFSLISVLTMFLVNKFSKAGNRDVLFWILFSLPLVASIGIAIAINMPTIIIFNLAIAIATIVLKWLFDVYRNSTLKEAGLYSEICEHQTMIESIINITRIVTFGAMILISFLHSMLAFQLLIVVLCALVLGLGIILIVYERKYCRPNALSDEKRNEEQFKKIMKILLTNDN